MKKALKIGDFFEFISIPIRWPLFLALWITPLACTPISWLDEARVFSHQAQWEPSFKRYEELLQSGNGSLSIYHSAEMVLEKLVQEKRQALIDQQQKNLFQKENIDLQCQYLVELEDLAPNLSESFRFPIFTDLSSKFLQRGSDQSKLLHYLAYIELIYHCSLEDQWLHSWSLIQKFEQHVLRELQKKPSVEYLNLVRILFKELKNSTSPLTPPFAVSHLSAKTSKFQHSPFSMMIEALVADQWTRYWQEEVHLAMTKNQWGIAWLFEVLKNQKAFNKVCKDCLHTHATNFDTTHLLPDDHLSFNNILKQELELYLTPLTTAQLSINSKHVPTHLRETLEQIGVLESPSTKLVIENSRQSLLPSEEVNIELVESQLDCTVTERQLSKEKRHLESYKKIQSPKHLVALKRVEKYQSELEAALSQKEKLEKSLLLAQKELAKRTLDETHHEMPEIEKLKAIVHDLEQQLSMTEQSNLAFKNDLLKQGPPQQKSLLQITAKKQEYQQIHTQLKKSKDELEIMTSALHDYQQALFVRRQEVVRLAGYLAKITIKIDKTTHLLDEKEELLAGIDPFEEEPIYTVFRYPVTEQTRNCSISWDVLRTSDLEKESLWTAQESAQTVTLKHRAYPRYQIAQAKVSPSREEKKLFKRARHQLARRFQYWFNKERIRLLVHRASELLETQAQHITTDELAFLTYLNPDRFTSPLMERIYQKLELTAPLLLETELAN